MLNIGSTEIYDFPIVPNSFNTDVSVINANTTPNNILHNMDLGHNSSLIDNMVTPSVTTQIQSSTVDNTNV